MPRVLRLGTACFASMRLPLLAQPHLDALSDRIGGRSSVSVLDGTDFVYVARAVQRKVMLIGVMPGSRLPAWCTSMGRVLLAVLSKEQAQDVLERSELQSLTPQPQTDPAAITPRA